MSEEITEKEEFIKIVSILRFSDVHPADCKYITYFIIDLAKENQQLKEKVGELTNSWNEQIKLTNQENLDCSKYAVENHHLKSVLDEIREYIKEKAKEDEECTDIRFINFGEGVDYDLLKILDKVKNE